MSKVHLVCSVLMAFCVSMFGLGCDGAKPAPKGGETKMEGAAPPAATKKTGKAKGSGVGSTTGGGVEVPAAGGTTEKPAVAPEVKPEAAPEVKPEATPEAKPEAATEAPKAE